MKVRSHKNQVARNDSETRSAWIQSQALTVGIALLGLTALGAGCSNSSVAPKKPEPEAVQSTPGAPEYQIVFQSDVSSSNSANGIAAYGFKILGDGRYQVGPAPGGQVLTGILSPEEFRPVQEKVALLKVATLAARSLQGASSESCETMAEANASASGSFALEFKASGKAFFKKSGEKFCTPTGSDSTAQADAQALYGLIETLASQHYPQTFPDDCTDSIITVQNLLAKTQDCQIDSDCAYVDNVMNPIPTGDIQWVMTDNCSALPSAVVANGTQLVGLLDEILNSKAKAEQICGDRFYRENCSIGGFQADQAAPVCHYGKCHVNAAVYL